MNQHFDIIGRHGGGSGGGRGGRGGRGFRGGRAIRNVSFRSFGPSFRTFSTSGWRYPWWGYYPQFFYPSPVVYQQPVVRQRQTSLLTVCEAWQHAEQMGDTLLAQQLRERCEDVLEDLASAGVDVRMAPLSQIGQEPVPSGGAGGQDPASCAQATQIMQRMSQAAQRDPSSISALVMEQLANGVDRSQCGIDTREFRTNAGRVRESNARLPIFDEEHTTFARCVAPNGCVAAPDTFQGSVLNGGVIPRDAHVHVMGVKRVLRGFRGDRGVFVQHAYAVPGFGGAQDVRVTAGVVPRSTLETDVRIGMPLWPGRGPNVRTDQNAAG